MKSFNEMLSCNEWKYLFTFTFSGSVDEILRILEKYVLHSDSLNFKYFSFYSEQKNGVLYFHGVFSGIHSADFISCIEEFGFCNLHKINDLEKLSSYFSEDVASEYFTNVQI